jgi:hypothetical protein
MKTIRISLHKVLQTLLWNKSKIKSPPTYPASKR